MAEEKIKKFKEIVFNQFKALEEGDSTKANKLMKEVMKIHHQLVELGDEGKNALVELMEEDDLPIKLIASFYSLPYNENKALEVLNKLSKSSTGVIKTRSDIIIEHWKNNFYDDIEKL